MELRVDRQPAVRAADAERAGDEQGRVRGGDLLWRAGLSLGGAAAHTLLARRPELLDRVVIDGCGALPAWWVGFTKLGVAVVSPFVHRGAVIGVIAQALGIDPAGRAPFAADMQAASPRAFRRAFAEADSIRPRAPAAKGPGSGSTGDPLARVHQ